MANEQAKKAARALHDMMDRHLATSPNLADDGPTLVGLALDSYTAVAPEGGVSLEPWPNVRAWLGRIEQLDGFVPMPRSRVA